jgi:hypothetical protein
MVTKYISFILALLFILSGSGCLGFSGTYNGTYFNETVTILEHNHDHIPMHTNEKNIVFRVDKDNFIETIDSEQFYYNLQDGHKYVFTFYNESAMYPYQIKSVNFTAVA